MNRRRKSFRKLDLAMSQLRRVVESEGSELVRDGRVRLALRELEKSRKGAKVDLDRIVKAVTLISEAASDRFLNGDERRK